MRFIILFLLSFSAFAQNSDFDKALKYFQAGQYTKSKPFFESYLKTNPSDALTREYLGDIAAHQKKWDAALDYYSKLVEEKPSSANYHFKYGGALGMKALSISKIRALTYIDDIKEHFNTAAELDPKHIEARWALVELYIQLPGILGGSFSKAESYAMELQKISPVDGYLSRGYVAEKQNDMKAAEKLYIKAIDVGGSPTTYQKLIDLYEKDNAPGKALSAAQKSFKIHNRNQTNYQIGKICAEFNIKPELGLASLKQYIANHSIKDGVPVSWAHFRIAQIYRNLGNKSSANYHINLSLADLPDFDQALEEKERIDAM
ncbi:MAG: hypothetical protein CMF34_13675 [Leeuwenhoekiella sp.]|uniref:tetratricopeptide repeat protein n=1 Tax=unclassified Leeuwenhoekiella TaxID=2615029 RepID=UPI000C3CE6DB|nr:MULTISPECIES: tetratricopeptide repeat protein [unclassified Leeuwenhoekiella]MAS21282.1 hypothetical protein [Leeuwenhoekiella sp.]MAW93922.1 hypothetical protein [Leeuwenhoekiella sp.]MBA81664.1 hypothetical protein [Leeuwenhoekiella sp.]|tara:strand:- start:17431 stop:18384 length:954 start_codon:yes stop_codon:yes gene_type:complete